MQTHFADIDIGDAQPIGQRFYHDSPEKLKYLNAKVRNMLDHGIAKRSSSRWVPKSENNPSLTLFCFKVEDCIDQIGTATYVSKFDLLKGY